MFPFFVCVKDKTSTKATSTKHSPLARPTWGKPVPPTTTGAGAQQGATPGPATTTQRQSTDQGQTKWARSNRPSGYERGWQRKAAEIQLHGSGCRSPVFQGQATSLRAKHSHPQPACQRWSDKDSTANRPALQYISLHRQQCLERPHKPGTVTGNNVG